MARKQPEFQPGAILHEVIIGAFQANGHSFEHWCKENGLTPSNGRNATFGQSRGEFGRRNLDMIINAAGRDFVRSAYSRRLLEYAEQLKKGAA